MNLQESNPMLNSYFLSDLHLLSSRSDAPYYQKQIYDAAQHSHTLILGGDIFDFKWSQHNDLKESIKLAREWIEQIVVNHPHCAFYYVLGNHDSHPEFVQELDRLAFQLPNLEWQPHCLRLGDCVFLHGDILDGGLDHHSVNERRRMHEGKPIPMAYRHWLYDAAVQAHLHRVVATIVRRHSWVLKKLSRYLAEQGLHAKDGVKHVYFGHTHRDMDSVLYDGLTFHNGGAPIRGVRFRIIETALDVRPREVIKERRSST